MSICSTWVNSWGAAEAPVGPVASGENSPGLPVLPWGFTRACAMMCHDVPCAKVRGARQVSSGFSFSGGKPLAYDNPLENHYHWRLS